MNIYVTMPLWVIWLNKLISFVSSGNTEFSEKSNVDQRLKGRQGQIFSPDYNIVKTFFMVKIIQALTKDGYTSCIKIL